MVWPIFLLNIGHEIISQPFTICCASLLSTDGDTLASVLLSLLSTASEAL